MSIASVVDGQLLMRIRMEYVEMPGLQLTGGQARRLWNLDQSTCEDILTALVEEQFLTRTPRGTYLRRGGGQYSPTGSAIGALRAHAEVLS
jgi:hypothetical protein